MLLLYIITCSVLGFYAPSIQASDPGSPALDTFKDPLDVPAAVLKSGQSHTQQSFLAITAIGSRVVAVGLRGLIVFSEDGGKSWRHARVPVQTDLVAVQFVNPRQGWASGHDGVILHTEDGGQTWTEQFESRSGAAILMGYYSSKIAAGDTSLQPYLDQLKLNMLGGASLPFLGIAFTDEKTGYAVGSFGMIVTTEDGGKTWLPWLDHIDNKDFLNLNSLRSIGGDLYIVGEQGGVYRLDPARQRFVSVAAPYSGSFFDIAGNGNVLLAFGLRGTAYRSVDRGADWERVDTGTTAILTGGCVVGDGSGEALLLAANNGQVVESRDEGKTFSALQVSRPMLFTAAAALTGDSFVLAGFQGIEIESVETAQSFGPAESVK